MSFVESFGAKVSDLALTHPKRARQLLVAGWRAKCLQFQYAPSKVSKSERMLSVQIMKAMITSLARPAKNVMVSLFTPCEPLHIRGLHPYSCEAFSAYLSGSMAEQNFLQKAEASGIPPTLCSYHKIFVGAAQTQLMPRPRFILSTSLACDANMLTFRYLSELYDVPHFALDIPFEKSPNSLAYVADQLREMDRFLAEQTGIPIDENRLIETVARGKRTMDQYNDFLNQRVGKLIYSDLTSELYRTASLHLLLGSKDSEAYVQQLLKEVAVAPPATGKQLVWMHTTPYWVLPLRRLLNFTPRVQIASCDMSYEGIHDVDPTHPYEAMATRLVYSPFNGPMEDRIQQGIAAAKQVHAHGAVWFSHWGCKHTLGGAQLCKKKFEEAGIPTLLLDGDACDRGFGGDGQAATRMEAFLELLEGQA